MMRLSLGGPSPATPHAPGTSRVVWIALAVLAAAILLSEVGALASSLLQARDARARMEAARDAPARLRQAEAQLAETERSSVAVGSLPEVLALVRESADDAGVRIEGVTPQTPAAGRASEPDQVQIEVSGNGFQVGTFVDAVERGTPRVPLSRLALTADPAGRVRAMLEAEVAREVARSERDD